MTNLEKAIDNFKFKPYTPLIRFDSEYSYFTFDLSISEEDMASYLDEFLSYFDDIDSLKKYLIHENIEIDLG